MAPPYTGSKPAYRLVVGRATSLHGPYRDKKNRLLTQGGGTIYLQSDKATGLIGPGGPAILQDNGQHLLIIHAYHANKAPLSAPQVRKILWDASGWPVDGGPY